MAFFLFGLHKMTLHEIERLTGGRVGVFDVACPTCGPQRRSPINRRRKVLRVWQVEPTFATFHCARCGEHGHVRDGADDDATVVVHDRKELERARVEADQRERVVIFERLQKARWLWSRRQLIADTIAEKYLREARGYTGPLPATLGFLPASGEYEPALIAAFGLPDELEAGRLLLCDDAVRGVHLTKLAVDGSGKAGTEKDKIMIGHSQGWPIVLAPANDLLGIAITEGVEDALSIHRATGLGAWAAGSASRLPALAAVLPGYIEAVSIVVDDDAAGLINAANLASRIMVKRGIEVRPVHFQE